MPLIEPTTKTMVLMFTDLAGSVDLKTRLGAAVYAGIISKHDNLFKKILAGIPKSQTIKDTGDGFLARFETASDAVRAALQFQFALHKEKWEPEPIGVRIGLHIGQVAELEKEDATGLPKLVGLAADIAARVMDLAKPGQILLTRTLFDDARQFIREHPPVEGEAPAIKWMAHGPYLFKGSDEPMDVFEVGAVGIAPLKEPPDSGKAKRAVRPGEEDLFGWRPAVGLEVPGRPGWTLDRKLGEGGFGEVWLAHQRRIGELRVFKFCFDADRLRSFKREMTLFRLLREALGDRDDIAKLWEVRLDKPPYFLESAFSKDGDLASWSEKIGGIGTLTMEQRLDLIARICDAVAAAHSVAVLHKDIKPSNILIRIEKDGSARPQLTDFGIGVLTDRSQLEAHQITVTGFTEIVDNDSSRTGTRMYAPPELLAGKPFTTKGDVYAIGVMLYQVVTGDLNKPLAHGWERDIADPLLREDIADAVAGDESARISGAAELAQRLRTLRRRRAERRRKRATRALTTAAVVLGLLLVAATALIMRERHLRDLADKATKKSDDQRTEIAGLLRENQSRLARLFVEKGWRDDGKNLPQSLLWFVEALKHDPDPARERMHRLRVGAALSQMPVVTRAKAMGPSTSFAQSPNRRWVATYCDANDYGLGSGVSIVDTGTWTWREVPVKSAFGSAVSPDGTRLLMGGGDGKFDLSLWNVQAPNRPLATVPLTEVEVHYHPSPFSKRDWGWGSTFSPNGTRLLERSRWGAPLCLRRTSDLALISRLADGGANARFNHDGSLILLTNGIHAEVRNGETGEPVGGRIARKDTPIVWADFSPDGGHIICASANGEFHVLDTNSRALLKSFLTSPLNGACLSPDGTRLAIIGTQLEVWDLKTLQPIRPAHKFRSYASAPTFSANGASLLFGDEGSVWLWRLDSPLPIRELILHGKAPPFGLTNTGEILIADRSSLRAWDFSRAGVPSAIIMHGPPPPLAPLNEWAQQLATMRISPTRGRIPLHRRRMLVITGAATDAAGKRLVTVTNAGQIALWDHDNPQNTFTRTVEEPLEFVELSADGKSMLTLGFGTARLWDLTASPPKDQLIPIVLDLESIARLSPDGARIVTRQESNGEVTIWDAKNLTHKSHPIANNKYAEVRFDPTGSRVLVTMGSVKRETASLSFGVFDAASGRHVAKGDSIFDFADIASDGHVAVVGLDRVATIFAPDGKPLAQTGAIDGLTRISFSPDGRHFATQSEKDARIWSTATGQPVSEVMRHGSNLLHLAFSPDGSLLATGCEDGTARVFDAATGEPVTPPIRHERAVHQVGLLPGDELLTVAGDVAFRWKLAPDPRTIDELIHVARLQASAMIDPTLSVLPLSAEQITESAAKLKHVERAAR